MFDTDFHEQFTYQLDDLGCSYTESKSTFVLWAPTAKSVNLALFHAPCAIEDYEKKQFLLTMKPSINGSWRIEVQEDLERMYYLFRIRHQDDQIHYVVDPYAKAVSANGGMSCVVDLEKTDPQNFRTPQHREGAAAPILIYELHIRDFSISEDSGMLNKGKYLAFTEQSTKNEFGESTGLDHIAELGVSHIQLMPFYDFKTVDETAVDDPSNAAPKYNWGYDPQNYFVPEGSYSLRPEDPYSRIRETKEMIHAIHQRNMFVIMDVVFNHTYEVEDGPFHKILPYYAYRYLEPEGQLVDFQRILANGSGTGNEIASEQPMMRKYIFDALKYWVEEYQVDGFRFDLMALIDQESMEYFIKNLREQTGKDIFILGEPWQAGGSVLAKEKQILKGTQKGKQFSVFNDHFRNAIKGWGDDDSKAFVTGGKKFEHKIVDGLLGAIDDFTDQASEAIQYVSAHDNLILWDKIVTAMGLSEEMGFPEILEGNLIREIGKEFLTIEEAVEEANPYKGTTDLHAHLLKRHLFAMSIILTSQGIPFIHAGDEFLRSKFGDYNSYRSPDSINKIRWNLKSRFKEIVQYVRELIGMRKKHPIFRMRSREIIKASIEVLWAKSSIVILSISGEHSNDSWKKALIIYNAKEESISIPIHSEDEWKLLCDGERIDQTGIKSLQLENLQIKPLSTTILFQE